MYEALRQAARYLISGYSWLYTHKIRCPSCSCAINIKDPGSVWIDERATIGGGTLIFPHVIIRGKTKIGKNCVIDTHALIDSSLIADNVYVGHFAQLNRAVVGDSSRVPHQCSLGDTEIGNEANIGAGVIAGNFSGLTKNKTIIKDGAFVGINVKFLPSSAGLVIGKEAWIFPGQTIQINIPDHAFVAPQVQDGIVRELIKPERSFKIPGHWKWFKTTRSCSPEEISRLFAKIKEIFGDVLPWFQTPQPFLGDATPINVVIKYGTDGLRLVDHCLDSLPV